MIIGAPTGKDNARLSRGDFEELQAIARATGAPIPTEQMEQMKSQIDDEPLAVWFDNVGPVRLFEAAFPTAWKTDHGIRIGLDFAEIILLCDRVLKIEMTEALYQRLKLAQLYALTYWSEQIRAAKS